MRARALAFGAVLMISALAAGCGGGDFFVNPSPSVTPKPSATRTRAPTGSVTPTATPTPTVTPTPSVTPTGSATQTPTAVAPTPTPTPIPTDTPTAAPTPTPTPAPFQLPFTLSMKDYFFSYNGALSPTITVPSGLPIILQLSNDGFSLHNLQVAFPDGTYGDQYCQSGDGTSFGCSDPKTLTTGQVGSLVVTFQQPGTYQFRCDYHTDQMTGTFVVQ